MSRKQATEHTSDTWAPEWKNAMDVLVCAQVLKALSAWSGTPKTARHKDKSTQQYGNPWEPDRSITQLYVPGLSKRRCDGTPEQAVPLSKVLASSGVVAGI